MSARLGWVGGVVASVVLLGPALGAGALLSLDLVFTEHVPMPSGFFGLGPELPRRLPLGAVVAGVASVVGGEVAGKALLVALVAVAFAGMWRLAGAAPPVLRAAGAVLYAVGPSTATRVGAGQWTVVAMAAALPWVVPVLVAPSRDLARTLLAATALGLAGIPGGLAAAVVVTVGLVTEERRRPFPVVAGVVVAQLPWLVPVVLVGANGVEAASAELFSTRGEGPLGVVGALVTGHGFWRGASQVGGDAGWGTTLLGLGLTALAVYGTPALPAALRRPLTALGIVGFAAAAVSAVPGLDDAHAWLTDVAPFSPLRESHRLLALFLVWMAPAAAMGAVRLRQEIPGWSPAALVFPPAAALALALPGLWGVEGRLRPAEMPDGWHDLRTAIRAEQGPVLAFPWHEYLSLDFAGDRRVLNPLPDWLGGDVLVSSDPGLGSTVLQESTDDREPDARVLAEAVTADEPIAEGARDLGVRWVVLLHEADAAAYETALDGDTGLRRELRTESVSLYEVQGWRPSSRSRPRSPEWPWPWETWVVMAGYATTAAAVATAVVRVRARGGTSAQMA